MDEVLSALILASLDRLQPGTAMQLCRAAGSVQADIDNRRDIRTGVRARVWGTEGDPRRLASCEDAPLGLF